MTKREAGHRDPNHRKGSNTFGRVRAGFAGSLRPGLTREGDERLSGSNRGEAPGRGKPAAGASRSKSSKANPVGRALRTVYDDTLRESVPDDFMDLLRKLD